MRDAAVRGHRRRRHPIRIAARPWLPLDRALDDGPLRHARAIPRRLRARCGGRNRSHGAIGIAVCFGPVVVAPRYSPPTLRTIPAASARGPYPRGGNEMRPRTAPWFLAVLILALAVTEGCGKQVPP